jgi:uncharacterized protein YegL
VANSGKYTLLPAYLVLDTSASMTEGDAFEAAFEFVPRMLNEMNKSASVADKLRIEVITFDQSARVVFPLGDREALTRWYEEKKANPIRPDGASTSYSSAFSKLREEIEQGVQQIRSESHNGEYFQSNRPVVFFITDGAPNADSPEAINNAYAQLTDPGFTFRPNVICVGVGKATLDDLRPYGAGKYKIDAHEYTTGNPHLVLVARDGVTPASALGSIIPTLIGSLISSVRNAPVGSVIGDDGGDVADIFGDIDSDLFGDEEELDDLLDMFND